MSANRNMTAAPKVEVLPLRRVRTDGGTQTRAAVDSEVIDEYAELLADDVELPPGVVFYDGKDYWLADGFHRHAAALRAGLAAFHFEMHKGSRRDALLYSVGANANHGLKRTPADKRRAVETLLKDHEWSRWSNHEIARVCGVGKTFVGKMRVLLMPESIGEPVLAKRGAQVYELRPAVAAQDSAAEGRNYAQGWLRTLLGFTPEQFVRLKQLLDGSVSERIVAEAVASVMLEASPN
jgi:hypothetical protein